MVVARKKLIEVALPLDAINETSQREMGGRLPLGHAATLHQWWARRPLAACRAIVFASMVDDPGSLPDEFLSEEERDTERERLHDLVKQLVEWKSADDNGRLLAQCRREIAQSVARGRGESAPETPDDVLAYLATQTVYDPFSGRGSIPVEAQRLGLHAIGSDLNPIAVLITKALIELPATFQGHPPVNPAAAVGTASWRGASGIADDIRWYGRWMREQAWARIGRAYPRAALPGGGEGDVHAWIWARTLPCPNPACRSRMPLLSTFRLSGKKGDQYWIRPIVNRDDGVSISFEVQNHDDGVPTRGSIGRTAATCPACSGVAPRSYLREQAQAGKMRQQLVAMVVEGNNRRVFVSSDGEHERTALDAEPHWRPEQPISDAAHKVDPQRYGITHWHQMFTSRQLLALTTLSDLLIDVRGLIEEHGAAPAYAGAVVTYLALAISRTANFSSSFCRWKNAPTTQAMSVFARPAIPMVWDFAETNPLLPSDGVWDNQIKSVAAAVASTPVDVHAGEAHQANAATTIHSREGPVIVTDPPYYDNYSYAELSDFFYAWLRPALREVWPDLFTGISAPMQEEMIAAPRFEGPRDRFEGLLNDALTLMRERCSDEFPSSIFYAYKQQETDQGRHASTGWETMLSALVEAGFRVVATWPVRTETGSRPNAQDTNSLASSVVIVCRPRLDEAPTVTRRDFAEALRSEFPEALAKLQKSNIAPVDLAQASIGPGMAVFTRYREVLNADGSRMAVRDALALINAALDETLAEQEGDFDADSRWALTWFEQHGYAEGEYGVAEQLSKAKNTSVEGLVRAGVVESSRGKVRVLKPSELEEDWDPATDSRLTAWETTQHLIRALESGGEPAAATLAARLGGNAETARELAYRLYVVSERKRRAHDALSYNALVQSWPEIARLARERRTAEQGAFAIEDR